MGGQLGMRDEGTARDEGQGTRDEGEQPGMREQQGMRDEGWGDGGQSSDGH